MSADFDSTGVGAPPVGGIHDGDGRPPDPPGDVLQNGCPGICFLRGCGAPGVAGAHQLQSNEKKTSRAGPFAPSTAPRCGLTGLVTLESVATAALKPGLMGYAPVLALKKLFEQTGTTPAGIDTIELNEAFASQAVAVIRDAKLDPEKTKPLRWSHRTWSPRRRNGRDFEPAGRKRSGPPGP